MKVALLIVHPQLEMDREQLLAHLSMMFKGHAYEIGLWSKRPLHKNEKEIKPWLELRNVRIAEGIELAEAGSRFAASVHADLLWIWHANERLLSEWTEDTLLETIARNGEVSVQAYSDRLGAQWTESRIQLLKTAAVSMNQSIGQLDDATEGEHKLSLTGHNAIAVRRPFIIAPDKQECYIELTDKSPLQQLLIAFSSQNYEKVLKFPHPPIEKAEWATFQFYKILALINLGKMEEASEEIYNAMEAELSEKDSLEFIYLYGKLAVNADIKEMKKDVLELLEDTVQAHALLETTHVLTSESDWLAMIAELQWQLGEHKKALVSWRHGLESSAFTNEGCAYRLAEAIYEMYKPEGLDKISRTILEIFKQSPESQALLYPIFSFLNMQEWAVLFSRPREASKKGASELPLVSIIMPIYNDTDYLFESIHSMLSQTYLNLELIIVDDGSTGEVAAIVQRFKHDNRLHYYRLETNKGLPHALNYGLSKAKGSLMGWTSADNKVHQRWLERMVHTISAHPNAGAVYSDYYHIDSNGLIIETKRMPAYKLNGLQNGGPSLLWRTSTFRKSGGFDEGLFGIEDRDFTVRLALAGRIVLLQEPLYYYRIHNGSLSSKIDTGSMGGWPELHAKLKRKWLCLSFV